MADDLEVHELCEVYQEMNPEGQKKMVWIALQLLGVQLGGRQENLSSFRLIDEME